jgi:hypothetical protein
VSSFDICYPFLLPNEDRTPPRYESMPDPTKTDPGAQAIAGINSCYWPNEFELIAAAPQNQRGPLVQQFYHVHFWNHWLDALVSNRIAAMALDAGVNQGQGWAVRFLQNGAGCAVDGLWGPETVSAVNAASLDQMVYGFIAARFARYRQVGGPSLPQWLARAAKVPQFM